MVNMRINTCYDQAGGIRSVVSISDDSTGHMMPEREFMKSEKMASMAILSASIAHELSNNLGSALRNTQLLLNEMYEDDPRRIYVEHTLDKLMEMSILVRGLLDLSRQSTPVFSPTDIPQSIRHILSSFSDRISAQNIEVECDFGENIPVIMNADVEQIFFNIIKNTIQAMPDGGILSISVKVPSSGLIEVRVSDTGPGIPDEILMSISGHFFTTKDFRQGAGLDLFVSKAIAESYNGSIDVEKELDKGTTFIVRLPTIPA